MYGGRYFAQALFAAWNLGEPWSKPWSGMRPLLSGSGKFGTP
jgi:hypothetical protein